MSNELFFRTEDLELSEVQNLFVETSQDADLISSLKGRNPTILVGSRGVGKSFLLRVAQAQMLQELDGTGFFPVYLSFTKGSLLQSQEPEVFRAWMIGKMANSILRALRTEGRLAATPPASSTLAGEKLQVEFAKTKIENVIDEIEKVWKTKEAVDTSLIPSLDEFSEAVEDLLNQVGLKRVALFIDEAAHVFVPDQQREFFSLFRDLRSSHIVCNAAVYPGVTSFGDTFQPVHDAQILEIDRDVQDSNYLANMREIVFKQADSSITNAITKNERNFRALAYAATGNPRLLLKTVLLTPKMRSGQVADAVRDFYRSRIWADHSDLANKYSGHGALVDWGREFVEDVVIPEVMKKNEVYIQERKPTSAYFWVSRKAPERVHHALRVLCYTGVIQEHEAGMRATRSEVGTRYRLNLGTLFAAEGTLAVDKMLNVAESLTPKRMTEFGAAHSAYDSLESVELGAASGTLFSLAEQMAKSSSVLDLTEFQKRKLAELSLDTVGAVFEAPLGMFKKAHYVGNVRARQMKNAAEAAVLEYLSG